MGENQVKKRQQPRCTPHRAVYCEKCGTRIQMIPRKNCDTVIIRELPQIDILIQCRATINYIDYAKSAETAPIEKMERFSLRSPYGTCSVLAALVTNINKIFNRLQTIALLPGQKHKCDIPGAVQIHHKSDFPQEML